MQTLLILGGRYKNEILLCRHFTSKRCRIEERLRMIVCLETEFTILYAKVIENFDASQCNWKYDENPMSLDHLRGY